MSTLRSVLLVAAAFASAACVSNERPIPRDAPPPYSARHNRGAPQPLPPEPGPQQPGPQQPVGPTRPPPEPQPQPDPYAHLPQGPNISLLEVRGMTCPVKCTREVKEQLQEAPGVTNVIIDYSTKVAIVYLAEGADRAVLPRYVRPPYSAHVVR